LWCDVEHIDKEIRIISARFHLSILWTICSEAENYLYSLDDNFSYEFCRFRTLNHKLPIESGGWQNVERNMIICNLCDENVIGNEFHYILECNYFNNVRTKYIDDCYRKRTNIIKFGQLMRIKNKIKLTKLCKFIKLINKAVCAPG
jgi:hypothetical protein